METLFNDILISMNPLLRSRSPQYRDIAYQRKVLLRFAKRLDKTKERKLLAALEISERAHLGQFREEGDIYLIHPIRVANILHRDLKIKDPAIIIAALLHDVLEDSEVISVSSLKRKFGARIARLVENLTRSRPEDETEESKRITKSIKLQQYFDYDHDTRLIKSADFLDNIRSWAFIPKTSPAVQKFPRWIEETEKYYLPIARQTDKYLADQIDDEYQTVKIISALHKL